MRLRLTCLSFGFAAAICAAGASAAVTAPETTPPPEAAIAHASRVTESSATLNATVYPNVADTLYYFSVGPTLTFGVTSPEKSVLSTRRSAAVHYRLTNLEPGTTYSYALTALSSGGVVESRTISFRTRGPSPAVPLTGAATVRSSTSATLTGVVNASAPQQTTYKFVISSGGRTVGTTTTRALARHARPVRIAVGIAGLKPFTIYRYTLVSTTGTGAPRTGASQSFETFPRRAPAPTVIAHTTPKSSASAPYAFATSGRIVDPTQTPRSLACAGVATVSFYSGKQRVSSLLAPLTSTCTFGATTQFSQLPVAGPSVEKLRVYVRFAGNHYLRSVVLKSQVVTLG